MISSECVIDSVQAMYSHTSENWEEEERVSSW